jgi:hypothetical protein
LRGEALTGGELMAVVGFMFMVLTAVSGVWWRIEGRVDRAKAEAVQKATEAATEAANVRADLAAHRLHCAETYITKAGMRESTELIMEALQGVKQAVDHMALRVDRVVENQASKPRPRAS